MEGVRLFGRDVAVLSNMRADLETLGERDRPTEEDIG